jgi:membrane-associated protein
MLVASLGAMRGDSVGYACGQRMGPKLLTRATAWFVTTHQLAHVRQFDARHGGETIVLARFVPVIRTLAPMLAGVAERPYGTCLASNIVGGLCWAISLSALDYGLGHTVPDMDQYLLPILGLMGLLALSPTLVRALQSGLQKRPRHG